MKRALIALLAVVAMAASCNPEPGVVKVTGVKLNQNTASVVEGESLTLKAIVSPSDAENKELSWKSSNDAVATVDQSGKVTGKKEGSATITATSTDGTDVSDKCELTVVKKAILVTAIGLDESEATLRPDETLQLTAVVSPKDATVQAVTWSSSDSGVATVDQNGLVKAVGGGITNITAASTDGSNIVSDPCVVTVIVPQPIFAKYKQITLREGQNLTADCCIWVYYGSETDYLNSDDLMAPMATCTSSNEGVVTVAKVSEEDDENFAINVYSVAPGTAEITVTEINGAEIKIPVTVTPMGEITEDWLPGISLLDPTHLYDDKGKGWYADGERFLGDGYALGTQCFHVKNIGRTDGDGNPRSVYLVAQAKFDRVDISAIKNPALYVRAYVSDVSRLICHDARSQFELASQGMDDEELTWTGGRVFTNWPACAATAHFELHNGWNTIVMPLDYAEGDKTGFRPGKVNWFRWYSDPGDQAVGGEYDLSGGDLEFAIDQLRVIDWTEYDAIDYSQIWMESGTANNWGAYEWKDELDGHHGVFGATDDFLYKAISNFWLRARRNAWLPREYSIPCNMTPEELKFVWNYWVDDPEYFASVDTRIELCTGATNYDKDNFSWSYVPGAITLKKGWNTLEQDMASHSDTVDPHSLFTFRMVLTPGDNSKPSRHSYYIDDLRIVPKNQQ